eukprot:c15025_g1_i1 orf=83-1105(+)
MVVAIGHPTMAAAASPSPSALTIDQSQREKRIRSSRLCKSVPPQKIPMVYSPSYNIAFLGLEKLHPFDSSKWGRIRDILVKRGTLNPNNVVEPVEATEEDLLVVHSKSYLQSLKWSFNVASIIEVPPVALLPNFIVQRKVLYPFRKQVGGTVLATNLAMERGWAINLGGGFHHCSATRGGGFCVFADISLCIQFAFCQLSISRAMIIDLDAHQGNGHARDFANDERVYILDMYNCEIYPLDIEAKRWIKQRVELLCGTTTEQYLQRLEQELKIAQVAFEPQLLIYNAGTDILAGDPLGQMLISPEGVKQRDEIVFQFAQQQKIPIVMLTSGVWYSDETSS